MNIISTARSAITSFKTHWKTPPKGRYMTFKEMGISGEANPFETLNIENISFVNIQFICISSIYHYTI